MRRVLIATGVLVLAGCSSSGRPSATSPVTTAGQPTTTTAKPSTATSTVGAVGSSFTLKGSSGTVQVTLSKVVDPATAQESYIKPSSGQRWVGVEMTFKNVGAAPFSDTLFTGLHAADEQGHSADIQDMAAISAGPMIDPLAGLHLGVGDVTTGWVTYSLPTSVKLARVQYMPTGGQMAEWKLS